MFFEACLISYGLHVGSGLYRNIKGKLKNKPGLPNPLKIQHDHAVQKFSSEKTETNDCEKANQAEKYKQNFADAVDRKQEKEADHYLKTSTASLVLSPISIFIPSLNLLNLGVIIYSSLPILRLAGNSVKEKKFRNDVLNALIVVGCLATGNFFVASLAVLIFHLGSKIVAKIRKHSEKMLADVFEQPGGKVWISKDGLEIETSLESLGINDIVIVSTGEVIPVDGVITEGMAMIDQQSLTGESIPAEKEAGDRVFASTLIVRGRICIKVEKAGKDTLASELGDILKKTADFKTGLQSRGEKWADKAAIPLLCTGVLSVPLLGSSPAMAVFNSSPGNMVRVFASLQTLNHITLASRKGILVKDGRALEELSKVDTVIFDKTGTLTKNQPKVGAIFCYNGYGKDTVLRYAATAEQKITHPFAKAILDKAEESGLPLFKLEDSEYRVGFGITARMDNKVIRTGSLRFMKTEGIAVPDKIREMTDSSHFADGCSLVMVALNEQLIGAIEIQPQVRPEAKGIISGLRQHGIRHISIVSGDHRHPTQQLADSLETDSYFYNILPENKADIVEQLQKKGRTVCFVGDGVNDAIAMKKANVSVSLCGAASVATDVAQVILMDGSLSHMCGLFDISKKLDTNLRQSLILGLGNGIICVGSALFLGLGILGSLILVDTFSLGVGISHAMLPLKQLEERKGKNDTADVFRLTQ